MTIKNPGVTDMRSLRWMIYDVFLFYFFEDSIPPSSDKSYRYISEEI